MSSSGTLKEVSARHTHALYRGVLGQYCSRIVYAGILALVFWLPLPLGSNRPWAVAVIELYVATLAFIWASGYLAGGLRLPRLTGMHLTMLVLWLLWLGWLVFQLLNIPVAWISELSPNTASLQKGIEGNEAVTEAVSRQLSILPHATVEHLTESLTYALLFWLVVLTCSVRHRLKTLLWAILLSGLIQAVYGGLMTLSGVEYGFMQAKEHYRGSATGTFINRNHFAGYLEITLAVSFGLLIAGGRRINEFGWRAQLRKIIDTILSPTILARVVIIVMFAALILSRSRMGNIAFVLALAGCGCLYAILHWKRDKWRILLLLFGFVLIDLWWIGGWFGGEALIERLESTRLETELRSKMLPDLLEMSELWLLTGAGMGSFHVIYPHFQNANVTGFNLHAHNDYLQFIIELGIPGTFLILSIAIFSVFRAITILLRRKEKISLGVSFSVLLATLSLGIHSLSDFNLQIPANAATLIVLLATVWCCRTTSSREQFQAFKQSQKEVAASESRD